MAKRIYQVAKSLGVKGVELVHYLRDQGFDVASHMSQVSAEMQESIDKRFAPAGDSSEKPAAKKAVKKVAKKATKKATVKKATKKEGRHGRRVDRGRSRSRRTRGAHRPGGPRARR
ncbi:MAG: translation initiation factor IF-2 N-terminal domain-containing protein [Candidatus Latescibacteria bacterium]|nr:translation initiation factor IF-2 N-terminal domain-containing protein [Candidatus Latescibacterota bacterium]